MGPGRPCALRGSCYEKAPRLRTQRFGPTNAGSPGSRPAVTCVQPLHTSQPHSYTRHTPRKHTHTLPHTLSSITTIPTAVLTYTRSSSHGYMRPHTTLVHRQTHRDTYSQNKRRHALHTAVTAHALLLTYTITPHHQGFTP